MGQALGCLEVDESTVAIRETFGKFDDVLDPGCRCVPWCFGARVAGHLSLLLQYLDVRCETKTKDNVFVTVVVRIQYRVLAKKAKDAFYKLSNTKQQIQACVFDVIRASVPTLELVAVSEQRKDIAKAVVNKLEKVMSHYEFKVFGIHVEDMTRDEHVKRVMNAIYAADEKAEAEKILQIKKRYEALSSKYFCGLSREACADIAFILGDGAVALSTALTSFS